MPHIYPTLHMDTCESAWHLLKAACPQAALPTPQRLCRLSAPHVSPGGSAGTSLALQLLNPLQAAGLLCTCLAHVAWPRVSGQLMSSHLPTCVPQRIHRPGSSYTNPPPPTFRLPEIPSPNPPRPGDSQRPELNPHLLAGG